MKKLAPVLCSIVLLFGTISGRAGTVKPLPEADAVRIRSASGSPLPVKVIDEADRIARLVAFVNSQPAKWRTPWYGAPVGKVYFEFYRDGKFVGNFYAGPSFFGRDDAGFRSQRAPRERFAELSGIAGFDVWAYVHEKPASGGSPGTPRRNAPP